jgi:hypothetical protein
MKKVRRENSRVLKTENDIYTNNFKPEFKTLMGLTKGEHDKACSYMGKESISRLSMLGECPPCSTKYWCCWGVPIV